MKTKIGLLLLVFAMLFCFTTACDDGYDFYGSISGTVTDRDTGEPLQNAEVTIKPNIRKAFTGFDGSFEFYKLDARQYEIWAQKTGYAPNHITVTPIAGDNVFVCVPLQKIK